MSFPLNGCDGKPAAVTPNAKAGVKSGLTKK